MLFCLAFYILQSVFCTIPLLRSSFNLLVLNTLRLAFLNFRFYSLLRITIRLHPLRCLISVLWLSCIRDACTRSYFENGGGVEELFPYCIGRLRCPPLPEGPLGG